MKLRFLGTGAADWNGPDESGYCRRLTSTLIDDALLIDVTMTVMDELPHPAQVKAVLFTHSHSDHYDPAALALLSPCDVYAHESWCGEIDVPGITVHGLQVGRPETVCGFTVTPMPANHSTARAYEQPLIYLLEKGGKRLLYATDGAWLLNQAHHIMGDLALDGAVFDATIGDGHDGDYRIFEHNSVDMVRLMVKTMHRTGRLRQDAPVFLTHLARTLHAPQPVLEANTEPPFVVCYDGLEASI